MASALNKSIPISAIVIIAGIVAFLTLFGNDSTNVKSNSSDVKIYDIPKDLKLVTISGKMKQYDTPLGSPQSEMEPEFVLVPDKDYPEINGAITVALYNLGDHPENAEYVQITGYYNPKNPDWYYPDQTQRTQQVIFVEKIIQIEQVDLGNEFTTEELRLRYEKIQDEFEAQKEQYFANEISENQYLKNLDELSKAELELYQDVRDHTFQRDEMTDYNFWHRGVMKFPTTIEQEISKITQNSKSEL